jgi:hypothetical protein
LNAVECKFLSSGDKNLRCPPIATEVCGYYF